MNLREMRADAHKRISAILDAAKADGRQTTDEEHATVETGLAEIAALDTRISAEDRMATVATDLDKPLPVRSAPADPAPALRIRDAIEDDPSRGYKTPRQFLTDVIAAGRSGKAEGNLRYFAAAGGDEQSTFSDPFGGYLIPETLMGGLLTIPVSTDMAPNTMRVPMASPTVKFNARVDKSHSSSVSGGLTVARRAEADTSSSSRMKFEQVALQATGLFGLAYATEEVLMDSPVSFSAVLSAGFADEFAGNRANELLNGTGVGQYLGLNNAACLITITKETGQAASTLLYENIIKMRARTWGYSNATWVANNDTIPQLMVMNQSVGTAGVPAWQPSAREDHPDMLLGRPLIFSEYPASVGTAGDIFCANWTQYLEGTLEPLQSAESVHVRFINHERCFKFWLRNDGRPWWSAALTPKNGSTLSPFVRLAARA